MPRHCYTTGDRTNKNSHIYEINVGNVISLGQLCAWIDLHTLGTGNVCTQFRHGGDREGGLAHSKWLAAMAQRRLESSDNPCRTQKMRGSRRCLWWVDSYLMRGKNDNFVEIEMNQEKWLLLNLLAERICCDLLMRHKMVLCGSWNVTVTLLFKPTLASTG